MNKYINVAKDFTAYPEGRTRNDSQQYSGQTSREDILVPALNNNEYDKVIVDANEVSGTGSFFWEEIFGGLIRNKQVSYETIKSKLEFKCEPNKDLENRIWKYIDDANKIHKW